MTEVVNRLKADGYGPCECGSDCQLEGRLGKPDRNGRRFVAGCESPAARGRRNRRKGDDKARVARKRMGIGGVNSRHEELWGGTVRVEVKAGAQVKPLTTRYLAAEAQSEAQRPQGDPRPFVFVAMPDGLSDGLVTIRLSTWEALIAPLLVEAS